MEGPPATQEGQAAVSSRPPVQIQESINFISAYYIKSFSSSSSLNSSTSPSLMYSSELSR